MTVLAVPPVAPVSPQRPAARNAEVSEDAPASLRVVVLEHPADLAPYLDAWKALADAAAEPNIFYEPCVLLPALNAFAEPGQVALVLILGDPPGPPRKNAVPELWGFFPLERRPARSELPLPCLRLWHHEYTYVPIPLVHRAHGAEVMTAFFDWLQTQRVAPPLLVINKLPVGGPFHQLVIEELTRRHRQVYVRARMTRALLAPDCDATTYQARAVGGKHRKEVRRQRKRLGELGNLEFVEMTAGDDLDAWMGEFLAIEGGGWKGREGSALGSKEADARYFQEMIRACHAAGKLAMTAVRLDGRPVAMQVMLRAGRGAYAFKLGYDESFARFSPGVLLELDMVERVAGGWSAAWVDSCAVQDHPMINRLWTERRSLESVVFSGDARMDLLLSLLPAAGWLKRALSSIKLGKRR